MYLFEMKKLPRRADKAVLDWDKGARFPARERETIALPNSQVSEFYALREEKQFLLKHENRMWFGGTDEEPFLVEMDPRLVGTYVQSCGSEQAFYHALVPENILKMTEEMHISYKRQGDIFAARFCGEAYVDKHLALIVKTKVRQGEFRILGTRHVGRGTGLWVNDDGSSELHGNALFKGIIEAPDHAPLQLDDAYYLLGQTRYIVNPRQAD